MAEWGTAINSVVSGGIGASIAAAVTAVVQLVGRKGESRATAADLVAEAAGKVTAQVNELNARFEHDNRQMRAALLSVIDCLDELIASSDVPVSTAEKLRAARRTATEAI